MKRKEFIMSLIKCPECSKEVSNKSHFCIHCGHPFNNSQSVNDLDEYKIGLGIYRAGIDFPN